MIAKARTVFFSNKPTGKRWRMLNREVMDQKVRAGQTEPDVRCHQSFTSSNLTSSFTYRLAGLADQSESPCYHHSFSSTRITQRLSSL